MKHTCFLFTSVALILVACKPVPQAVVARPDAEKPFRVEAAPFQGKTYRTIDGRLTLTLISKDECEYRDGQTTLLCKYANQESALRVIMNVLGAQQVEYFRETSDGLRDNRGAVLLNAKAYEEAANSIRQARQREEEQRQRVAEVIRKSRVESETAATYQIFPMALVGDGHTTSPDQLIVTDVSIKTRYPKPGETPRLVYFADVRGITIVQSQYQGEYAFKVSYQLPGSPFVPSEWIATAKEAEAQKIRNAVVKSFQAWQAKFPEAAAAPRRTN